MVYSNLQVVLGRVAVLEQRLPRLTLGHLAAIDRTVWRRAAQAALATLVRTREEQVLTQFLLQSVMVLAPRGNTFAVGASFPDSPWQQAVRAGRELNRIFYPGGRRPLDADPGESNLQRRIRLAGGPDAIGQLQRQLSFAREIVQAFIDAPVTPNPDDPESGKVLDELDRARLASPDPFGREPNALLGHLMILLGFYPPYKVNGEGGRAVSPNFTAASLRIGRRIRAFAEAHFGDQWQGRFPGGGRLGEFIAAVLLAWRDLVLTHAPDAVAQGLRQLEWGKR